MSYFYMVGSLIYAYLFINLLHSLYVTFCASKRKLFGIQKKYHLPQVNQDFSVIVYSQNNEDELIYLIEALKNQDYPHDKYKINVILDNCTDNSSNVLERLGGVAVWRINSEDGILGKNASISWLLDKLQSSENTNSYVFLNANRIINNELLNNVNIALDSSPVVTGETLYIDSNESLFNKLTIARNKFSSNLTLSGRSRAGFDTIIDTDMCAIRQNVLENVRFTGIGEELAQVHYSLLLAKHGIPITFNPIVQTYSNLSNLSTCKLNLNKIANQLYLMKEALFNVLLGTPVRYKEFVLSFFKPNLYLILTGIVLLLLIGESHMKMLIDGYLFLCLYSLLTSMLDLKDCLMFCLSFFALPFKSVVKAKKIKIDLSLPKKEAKKQQKSIKPVKKMFDSKSESSVEVLISDGYNNLSGELILSQDEGLHQVCFKFKNKKLSSGKHIRYSDAITEVSDKLSSHGFILKICKNCMHFKNNPNGQVNVVEGICKKNIIKNAHGEPQICADDDCISTLLWNSCKYINPKQSKIK